jgi:hypothetical protein
MFTARCLALLGALTLLGCASRSLPAAQEGAAALDAEAAAPAAVTRALDGDPPLPGQERGWIGLSTQGAAVSAGHDHAAHGHGEHAGHAGHGHPGMHHAPSGTDADPHAGHGVHAAPEGDAGPPRQAPAHDHATHAGHRH